MAKPVETSIEFPKFRHNLWTSFEEAPGITFLTASHGKFEVPRHEAEEFMQIRGYCTGHNSIEEIALKSGFHLERVYEIIKSLAAGDLLRRPWRAFEALSPEEISFGLLAVSRIWAEQLRETHIAADVFNGNVSRQVAVGWLLETYHYVRAFPAALQVAVQNASGELQAVLKEYARQEEGHEIFVEQTLIRLGLTSEEIRNSIPLVTTRLIDLLMREMFASTPCSALLVAALVEADSFEADELPRMQRDFTRHYGSATDSLDPFLRHAQIDADLGHGRLAERHHHLLQFSNGEELHQTVNRLHDLKHAFDAGKLEIKDYYNRPGNYFPRQKVDFFSI